MTPAALRDERIDALRGLAVFGILLVNIWSFVWGFTPLRYGVLPPDATPADTAAVALVAFFAEQKFYPVFAFLFGAGFVLITRALRRRCGRWRDAQRLYRRRLSWLLGCGVLHGTLVWFGDILTLYAIAGFWVLAGLTGARPRALVASLRHWSIVLIALSLAGMALNVPLPDPQTLSAQAHAARVDTEAARLVYTHGHLPAIARQRLHDYGALMTQSFLILPHVAVLFLLGALSVRRGWLTQPRRHRAFWRRTRRIGLAIGIPFNLAWAAAVLHETGAPYEPSAWNAMLIAWQPIGGTCLAAAYVATFMLADGGIMRMLQRWLAPVGRMALTHYLTQSLLCAVLLQGFGLALGARAAPSGLLALACAIMLAQTCLSHWWLARFAQGPIETWQRRWIMRA